MFAQAIEMSGSYEALWATGDRIVNDSRELIQALSCDLQDSRLILKCLQTRSVDDFQDAVNSTVCLVSSQTVFHRVQLVWT